VTVPRTHRPQRVVPEAYVVHREDLAREEIAALEGVPVVTLDRAVRECASDGIGHDLLVQAVSNGRARGLLTAEQATALARELDLGRIAQTRA